MRIIVVSQPEPKLEGMRNAVKRISEVFAKEIVFVMGMMEALELLDDGQQTLVVSGQIIGMRDRGTDLARLVKRANPNSLFFMYSICPETNECVDGVIPVDKEHHALVARILTSDLSNATRMSLKTAFPEIA